METLKALAAEHTGAVAHDAAEDGTWRSQAERLLIMKPHAKDVPFPVDWYACGNDFWFAGRRQPPEGVTLYMGCTPNYANEVPAITTVAHLAQHRFKTILTDYRWRTWHFWCAWRCELMLSGSSCAVELERRQVLRNALVNPTALQFTVTVIAAGSTAMIKNYLAASPDAFSLPALRAAALFGLGPVVAIIFAFLLVSVTCHTLHERNRLAWRTKGWDKE